MRAAVLFQVASIALVWSSLRSPAWLGVTAGAIAITVHLASAETRQRELLAIITFGLAGLFCESALMVAGVITFPGGGALGGVVCPPWVVLLWAALGTLAHGPMSALRDRPWLAGVLALVFAPLSFLGGEAAGAITIARPLALHLVVVGVAVGVTFWGVFAVSRRATRWDKAPG